MAWIEGVVDSKGHLELREDPEAWIKNNPASRVALVTSLKLNLWFEDDVEVIGESIGELTQLIRLEFHSCRSLKRVPNAITRLHKLEHLEFHYCECLEELPANIGHLVSLTYLAFVHCNNIKFLLNTILKLSNLTSLSLDFCGSLVELPANIGQLASLTHLKLTNCINMKYLLMSVANLPKLTSLSLSSLSLSEIPSNLGDLIKSLTRLDLSYCNNIKFLPNIIVSLSNLTSLYLSHCDCLVELPANISQLVSLTQLKLDSCDNIKPLLMSIANLCNLTSLTLNNCDTLIELPSNLGQMKSLSHLELYKCNKIKSLPDSMKDLCSLDTLFIHKCNSLTQLPINLNVLHLKLIDCCPRFLPTGLINLKYLEVVVCSCSDESFANLEDPYSLQHLSISGCTRHTNPIIIKVPARLNQFVNLQVLSLCAVHTFELPTNFDGLTHLYLVDIRFSSSIKCLPWSITKLRKLLHLMLPKYFRLETLPYELNNSIIISVEYRHVRKSWGELKTEIGELPIPFGAEIGNDAAQNPSILSHPGYLWLKENPSQWIIDNRNLLKLVRFLDLEYVEEFTDSIMQFSELTHLYLDITVDICLPDNYFVTFTRLTHLSLDFVMVDIDESNQSITHSLSKLSNLETLHLRFLDIKLPAIFNMPVSLKHLSLSYCNNMRPLYDSLEKLTNLKTLDLDCCRYCESLPPFMYLDKLRLIDCYFESFPIGLHHLEILIFEIYKDLGCIFEKCWNQLVNLETLSITCSKMEFLPEEIARLRNLQKLLLKDCINLKKLPSNLHELVKLQTLDISITKIKSLPHSFVKPRNLQRLILPKCFNFERLPRNLIQVSIIDDTEEAYYKTMHYDASLYQASADTSDESEDEETELGVIPGESCNEDNNVVSAVEIHETVPDEQTFADPFNSTSTGYIEHITTEQGSVSQICKDSHFSFNSDPIDENIQHTALCSQNQFNSFRNGGFMTNLPGAYFFGVKNQHVINDGQFGNMTLENEHGIASICQHISSWDGKSIVLDLGHNNNSQSYHANVIRLEKEITLEAILEPLPRFVDAVEKHDGYNSLKEMPCNINDVNQRLIYHCSMQSPPKGLMKTEHLKIALCECSKELLVNLKESMNLMHLAIKDCSQHHVKKFPTNLYELANLKTLSIQCIHIESLPSFAGLSSLLKLYIGGVSTSSPRLEKLPADLDKLDKLLAIDIHDTKIKCLPWSIKNLQKLRFLNLPLDFRLETLPCQLIESVVITVDCMHIRKTWKELKTEMGLLSFHGVGVDEAQNFSTISSSGYLQLKEDPGLWIMKNYDLCVSVRSLELEFPVYLPQIGDSIGELPKLTYLYISGNINLDLKYLSGINKMLRHLSLQHCNIEYSDCLGKLSNLESLCLDLGDSNLPDNLELLVNLKHLFLRHGSKHSNIDSMARLSNLKALELFQCDLESLPANLKLAELKLSGSNIKSLPTSLHRLEILHDKGRCERTKCDVALNLKQLINIEKLSVTCYSMKLLPSIKRLQNLQELQLKDCSSLEALPNYLGKLVKLCTLDISGTRIKSLPDSITKLSNLENLILPKCFQQDYSKYSNKGVTNVTTDDIVELYFNDMSDDDDDYYETSMEISCDEQTLPHNLHDIKVRGDPCYNRGETSNPSGESSHAMQYTITTETEQGIAPACDTKKIDCGEINHLALESALNDIPQSNNARVKVKRKDITLEMLQPFWSNHTKLVDAAEELGVKRSTLKRRIKELNVMWPRKGKKQQLDAKKRKHNNKAPFESDCSQQDLVNLGNSAAHSETVGECIMGSDLHMLPNHVSSNSNAVINLTPYTTMETIRGNLMETIDSHQVAEVHLDGANEHTLSDTLPQNEKSSNFIVKATYKDDTIRFEFSLSKSIDQLKEEVGKRLDFEVGTFKLKYEDEEKEWILMTCISDLEHALNLSRSSNNTNIGSVVRLLVVLKP